MKKQGFFTVTVDSSERGDSLDDNNHSPRIIKSDNGRCPNTRKYLKYLILIGIILYLVIVSYEIFQGVVEPNEPQSHQLAARIYMHRIPRRCSDFYDPKNGEYGCCSVFDRTGSHNISWSVIRKTDINGTNCPSLKTLVNKYIEYSEKYFNPVNCTIVNCCKVNYAIDRSMRNNYTIHKFLDPRYEIEIPSVQLHYYCNIRSIIEAYESHYESPNIGIIGIVIIMLLILLCLAEINR